MRMMQFIFLLLRGDLLKPMPLFSLCLVIDPKISVGWISGTCM